MAWSSARHCGAVGGQSGTAHAPCFLRGGFSGAISKRRDGYVEGAQKWRQLSENRARADQQNHDGPGSQQHIEDSESKEDVSHPARARYRDVLFGRNSDSHVKKAPLKCRRMEIGLKIRRWLTVNHQD
jgi:hypothetical protein